MGWEVLEQWGGDVARIEPLTGGVANDVWSVRVNGHLAVGRLGARSDADLAWETGLLQHLDREGLTVPVPIPTTDGRLFADGVVVMTYVKGGPPETEAARAIVRFGFDEMRARQVSAWCFEANRASARVLEKAGLCLALREEDVDPRSGQPRINLKYTIGREAWR